MFAPRTATRISVAAIAGAALLVAGCSSKSSSSGAGSSSSSSSSSSSTSSSSSSSASSAPVASTPPAAVATTGVPSSAAATGGALPPAIVADGGTSVLPGPFAAGIEAQYGPICKGADLGIPKFDPKTATIGWAQSEKEANPFRIQSTKSEVAEAAKRGIKLLTTNAQSNVQQENTDIKGMIDKGAKGIIFSPINSTGLGDAIAYAKSKHVAMVPVDRNITGVKACMEVGPQLGSDFVQQGKRAADAMITATKGTANLLILLGATGVNVTDDRTKGFKDELTAKGATGIKIVAEQTADFTREKGQSVTETEIKAHPEINAIYAENDEEGVGALVALTDAGKAGIAKTHLISIDGTKTAVQGVVDGNFDAVIESNPAYGPAAEDALAAYVNGDGYPAVTITTDEAYLDKASAAKGISSGTAY